MGIDISLLRRVVGRTAGGAWAALVVGWLVAGACAPAAGPPAAATAPAAPVGAPASAQDKVVLAVNGRPDQAAMQLAIDRGYFAEQGIAIETVQLDGSAQLTPAMATNQVDVGSGAVGSSTWNSLARGTGVRIVADYRRVGDETDTSLSFLVRKDLVDSGRVRSIADLRGASVALGPSPGSTTDILAARAALKDTGSEALPFVPVYVPFPDTLAGFASGKFDAGILTEPQVTQAVQQQLATVLYPAGRLLPGLHLALLYYSPDFASRRPEVATRFMVAYLRGVRDYHDAFFGKQNLDATIADLTQSLPLKDPAIWRAAHPTSVDLNGEIDVASLDQQAWFYREHGLLGDAPDIAQFVDTRFAQAAVQQLGRR
jgi:NitT/TauT family transport system substrate-binding protein